MNISILCSDENHPVNAFLVDWIAIHEHTHQIQLARHGRELVEGDILFLISCNEIIRPEVRKKFKKTFVIHASDLPQGRGWSPHVWQIIEGRESITVSLLEAADTVDSGAIWRKEIVHIPKDALWNEINNRLFFTECKLMTFAVQNFGAVQPLDQDPAEETSYYPKRCPKDSEIDPHRTIAEQFNLIRVCDPDRFPAFFKYLGSIYEIRLIKK